RRWGRIRARLGGAPAPLLGTLGLGAGGALCAWAYHVDQPALLLPSLTAVLLGAAAWLGGLPLVRAVALPSSFLLFAFPLPTVLVNQFIYPLQLATASIVGAAFSAVGMPTAVQAEHIYRDGKIFQVIESCSGVRGAATLLMSSFLYHDLFYRSRLQSTLVVLGAIPIALFVNHLRVITIVLNPYSSFAAVHTAQGLVMIVLSVLLLAVWDALLTRLLPQPAPERRRVVRSPFPTARLAAVAACIGLLAVGTLTVPAWRPPQGPMTALSSIPPRLDGWRAQGMKLDRDFLGSVSFSEWVHRAYEREGERVELLLGSDVRTDPRVDFSSPKLLLPGAGWSLVSERPVRLPSGREITRAEVVFGSTRKLVYGWEEGTGPVAEELVRSLLALDRSAWRRPGRAVAVRMTTALDDPAAAEARLAAFATQVEGQLDRILSADGA
ncbi:MAG TPA: exosortase/archaeosortase family protein, partial [Myxococcota bacterium]|nr:exosortase/archaeosortase family protein [Myxococcota bacterium]